MHFLLLSILLLILPEAISGLEDLCSNDFCNGNGYCSTNEAGTEAKCSCFSGFDGESCEFSFKSLVCFEMDCGFSSIQGECVVGPTGEATCYCYSGWDGDDCSVSTEIDYCDGISCNNQGTCIEDLSSENMWSCVCDSGWAGSDCGEKLQECGHEFLLDIFTRLAVSSDDLSGALECSYTKPIVFSAGSPSSYDSESYPFCVCSTLLEEYGLDDYTHLLTTCNMNHYREIEFIKEAESYCPACDSTGDAIMEEVITTKSAACYHFVYNRAEMGLYWRSRWKCDCVMDVGNALTTATIVTCPFTQHTSTDDYISYENCGSGKICDWEAMYSWFETEYSQINLEGSVACKDWMEAWIFTIPGEQRFEWMTDTFCPCLSYLKGTAHDLDNVMDCIPVTFHQLSMKTIYEQLCYDPLVSNFECLNYINYGTIMLGSENYTAAALCYGAIELASSLDTITDNLGDLMCDCAVPLYENNFESEPMVVKALDCVTTYFDFDVESCPAYDSGSSDAGDSIEEDNNVMNGKHGSFSTSLFSGTTTWETITIVEIPISIVLIGSAYYLRERKAKLNK